MRILGEAVDYWFRLCPRVTVTQIERTMNFGTIPPIEL